MKGHNLGELRKKDCSQPAQSDYERIKACMAMCSGFLGHSTIDLFPSGRLIGMKVVAEDAIRRDCRQCSNERKEGCTRYGLFVDAIINGRRRLPREPGVYRESFAIAI
ncbi:TPA: hypothetical protein DDW69_03415 [candidate division CPR2 bacterium]|uniref:Uncharacterized protein n=1 Tax=candidate division CPR2 bacterium GW2011_GWC1_41_48 TaxID=1618344 RepID=A0A0G0W7S1_UNCC2|nr:MAG: hypothetical protein UT47_C0003G0120 [candidate division CPR2 bacterium GW2011_GWC2_39_35]KKR27349.1 MAG: hypothetical protein UT60_C0052G0002 [candidate division CPR2 bacterium GW2011_GWD2_39_7]KKS09059.1 MAG: hypothetical protein UU65_C0003G0114 [candidate division CPR2 bacterium GW2011_GWC1_41_48]OGB70825.1 MAG: hypothetical protein A2Y26_02245 [candidate division CPR2 bacterium GWD2_39_7]HBG81866.1 hypothetical protein [candidate division CPR2 bacterium]